MKRILLFVFLALGFWGMTWSQENIKYDIEPNVDQVLKKHREAWLNVKEISGYRIQIQALSGSNSRAKIAGTKAAFCGLFPDIPCYLSYAEPNFRVRVGNFYSRLEAMRYLKDIKANFPGSFIVKDKVFFTEF
ncbi:MAG: SPOR domain-containing protein [Bacteroidales bacterium]|jgi:hypothetical protein|nr:SPOR domain-containing protein [Bacteroidales bacterium]